MSPDSKATISFRAIQQPGIVEQIIDIFKQYIMRGELRAGQRLPSELELSQQLGVGRSAVREAMKILQALGVVVIRQGDGTYIADKPAPAILNPLIFAMMLESDRSFDFYELRYSIQFAYYTCAARNATEEDWAKIEATIKAAEDYVLQSNNSYERIGALDYQFHLAVLEATHNPLLIHIGQSIEEQFFAAIYEPRGIVEEVSRHHRALLEAMREQRSDKIQTALDASMKQWRRMLDKRIQERKELQIAENQDTSENLPGWKALRPR